MGEEIRGGLCSKVQWDRVYIYAYGSDLGCGTQRRRPQPRAKAVIYSACTMRSP